VREVAAFDTASGLQRWWRTPDDEQAGMSVAVDATTVYATESPDAVRALDAATGAQQWRSEPGGMIATGDGGVIVVQWTGDPEDLATPPAVCDHCDLSGLNPQRSRPSSRWGSASMTGFCY
jgi:outer membrane protein assembly factor BamB